MPHPFRDFGLVWFIVAVCFASHALTNNRTNSTEAKPSADSRPLRWQDVDGYLFGAFGNESGWEAGAMGYGALVLGWNPNLAGFTTRLSGAVVHQGTTPPDEGNTARRLTTFGYGLDEAWVLYPSEIIAWKATVQMGLFRWRSHPDAALTGEYLTHEVSYAWGQKQNRFSWEALDSLTTVFQGLRLSLNSPGNRFRQEAITFIVGENQKTELSFLWSTAIAPGPGLEAGIVVVWDKVLGSTAPPSTLSRLNQYPTSPDSSANTSPAVSTDTAAFSWYKMRSPRYTARLTLDPMAIWSGVSRSDRGGRFFLETSLMSYEKFPEESEAWHRQLHFNLGLYLPAFGIFDAFRIQGEFSPDFYATNSLSDIDKRPLPVPGQIGGASDTTQFYAPYTNTPTHLWQWQLFISRAILPWLNLQAKLVRSNRLRQTTTGFELLPTTIRTHSQPWTAFEVRLLARL